MLYDFQARQFLPSFSFSFLQYKDNSYIFYMLVSKHNNLFSNKLFHMAQCLLLEILTHTLPASGKLSIGAKLRV